MVTFNLYFVGEQYLKFEYTDGLMETVGHWMSFQPAAHLFLTLIHNVQAGRVVTAIGMTMIKQLFSACH